MSALITKTRSIVVMALVVASMGLVAACDDVDDAGDGMEPPAEPMQ